MRASFMFRLGRLGGVVTASALACAVWGSGGCTATKQTELVPGIVSQIQVPRNLRTVRIDVQPQGQQSHCYIRSVDPNTGGVTLPRTLGVVPNGDNSRLVTVTITGYTVTEDDPSVPKSLQDCLYSPFNDGHYSGEVKILRRSRQPYVDGKILFVPMPLRYSCWDAEQCKDTDTCVAGKCVPADVDSNKLTEFNDGLIDGTANTCFSPKTCLADALLPAKVIDAATCKYATPLPMVNGSGVNVRVYYDSGETEVLDADAATTDPKLREGFSIPDAAKPQEFQLAPNLCDLVKQTDVTKRRILEVRMGTICPPKTVLQPICDGELNDPHTLPDGGTTTDGGCNIANELQPAPSALYVLLDNSLAMKPIYGPMGLSQVLAFSLNDPVFRTTSLAFKLLPHAAADCTVVPPGPTTVSMSPDVPFDLASKVQQQVAAIVGDASKPLTTDPPLLIDALLQPNGAYKALLDFRGTKAFNRMAVMLILNRVATDDCGIGHAMAVAEAAAAFGAASPADRSYTYVVMLGNGAGTQDATNAQAIATAGGPAGATQFFDARTNAAAGAAAFNAVVSDLGSCLYEKPANIDVGAVISYTDPLTFQSTNVAFSTACNEAAQNTATGWNIDAGRVRICGKACTDLRTVLSNAANFALSMSLPAPNIPVTATQLCK